MDFFPWLKQVETVFLSVNRGSKVKLNGNVAGVLQQLYGITQDRKKCTLSDLQIHVVIICWWLLSCHFGSQAALAIS